MPLGAYWIQRRTGSENLLCVAHSAGLARWVVAGGPTSGAQTILTGEDADLDSWTARTPPDTYQLLAAKSDDASQFHIVGRAQRIASSSDGITWAGVVPSPGDVNTHWTCIDYGPMNQSGDVPIGSSFLLASDGQPINYCIIEYYRTPAVSWAQADIGGLSDMFGVTVRPSDKLWVSVGVTGKIAFRIGGGSGYPTGWQANEYTLGGANTLRDIQFANGLFVAVGDGGQIWTSTTALSGSWTQQTSPTVENLRSVLWSGTTWLAVGDTGTVITSLDGFTWNLEDSGVTDDLQAVAYDAVNEIALAVAPGGLILSSYAGDLNPGNLVLTSIVPGGVAEDGGTLIEVVGAFDDYLGQEFEVHVGPNGDETDPKALSGVPGHPTRVTPLNGEKIQVHTPLMDVGDQIVYVKQVSGSLFGRIGGGLLTAYKKDYKTSIYDHRKAWAPIMDTGPRVIEEEPS